MNKDTETKGVNPIRHIYEMMMSEASKGISWSASILGTVAIDLEREYRAECKGIERIIRDAIVDYNDMIRLAPSDEAEADIKARAEKANAWLHAHGFEKEKLAWEDGRD